MHNFNRNNLFNQSVNWHLNLNRNDYVSIHLNNLWLLHDIGNDLLHFQYSRDLNVLDHHSLCNQLLEFRALLVDLVPHKHFPYHFNRLLNCQVNVSRGLDLYNALLNDWYVDNFLNLDYLGNSKDFLNNLLHDLRHLNHFFYYSWNNNNFLHYPLHFDNFRHLNQFLNYFFNHCWNIFDSLHNSLHRHDPILNNSNDLGLFHKMIDNPFYLFYAILI